MKNKVLEKDLNDLINSGIIFRVSDTMNRFGIFGFNPEDESRTFLYVYDKEEDRNSDLENYNKLLND